MDKLPQHILNEIIEKNTIDTNIQLFKINKKINENLAKQICGSSFFFGNGYGFLFLTRSKNSQYLMDVLKSDP